MNEMYASLYRQMWSGPQNTNMGCCVVSIRRMTVRKACGQLSGCPSVLLQSCARISAPMVPPPSRKFLDGGELGGSPSCFMQTSVGCVCGSVFLFRANPILHRRGPFRPIELLSAAFVQ
jgi:hypothetical protein